MNWTRLASWVLCVGVSLGLVDNGHAATVIAKPIRWSEASPSRVVRSYAETGEKVIAVPEGLTPESFCNRLAATGRYEYVTPNTLCRPARRPDDPRYAQQWHHRVMQSDRAWDVRSGIGCTVVVGLVDTGVDKSHPDLAGRFVSGWDMVEDKAESAGGDVSDAEGHGTQMAGLIAATGNNNIGISGMGWGVKIMPIRILPETPLDQVLAAARKAADLGCSVVNVSYEGAASPSVGTTGTYCSTKNAMLVYSAGNNGQILSQEFADVLVVGASDVTDHLASGSAHGPGVDLLAPGTAVLTTARYGYYVTIGGTSASAAIASGVAAMMRWVNPYMTMETWFNNIVRGTVDIEAPGRDSLASWGRLDSFLALSRVVPYVAEELPYTIGWNQSFQPEALSTQNLVVGTLYTDPGYRPTYVDAFGLHELPRGTYPSGEARAVDDQGIIYGNLWTDDSLHVPVRWLPPYSTFELLPTVIWNGAPLSFLVQNCNNNGIVSGQLVSQDGTTWFIGFTSVLGATLLSTAAESTFYPHVGRPNSNNVFAAVVDDSYIVDLQGNRTPVRGPNGSLIILYHVTPHNEWLFADENDSNLFIRTSTGTTQPIAAPPNGNFSIGSIFSVNDALQASCNINNLDDGSFKSGMMQNGHVEFVYKLMPPSSAALDLYSSTPLASNSSFASKTPEGKLYVVSPLYKQGQGGLTVNCGMILGDYTGNPEKAPITIRLFRNGGLVETVPNVTPGPGGYVFSTLQTGVFDVDIVAPRFLHRRLTGVEFKPYGNPSLSATLINGDVDGDNVIGLFDYLALSEAFDSVADQDGNPDTVDPSSNWNETADLDGDESVSLFDYLILSNNFDREGD